MIAAIGSGVALTVANGLAEQAAPPAATERHVFSPADRDAFLDARIAALHAGLRLTPEQEKLWPGVETALRKAGRDAIERVQKFKESPATENLIERLKRRGENAVARGQNLQAIASAAAPLYATLSDEQKHRLPVLMHALRPHFLHHRFAMMDDFREHWGWRRGDWDEPRGFAPEESEHPSPKER
jgi:hypothetical protein